MHAADTLLEQIHNPDGRGWGWRLLLLDGGQKAHHPPFAAPAEALASHDWVRPLLFIADPKSTGDSLLMAAALDLDQVVHRVLGLAGKTAILLVRPDGYLSFGDGRADLPYFVKHVATFAIATLIS